MIGTPGRISQESAYTDTIEAPFDPAVRSVRAGGRLWLCEELYRKGREPFKQEDPRVYDAWVL
jgi:hypothetical protein